jgi:hypothetical protein
MIERHEAERLAAAIHQLRPDWPQPSLETFIWNNRYMPLLDVTVELAWVAQLPETQTPARIHMDGPWRNVTRPAGTQSASAHIPHASPDDCAHCGQPEPAHHHVATYGDHTYVSRIDHRREIAERYQRAQDNMAANPTVLNPYANNQETTP